ncbi:hypothetical protein NIES2119_10945 [[Phormidium ambiguum] IAM M-71]|uniref:Isopropylmalate/homocitrate/citramalate synthase n=1 Tax=[Phormidium ambiguum] IAM M-71 TaxID=454136 RepID=A0A1U7ILL0_9CYAN|nr:hypothetical protein [Phormidium ambiguum]OKH38070.1 hypothetical protein NIES2119_10945 [Phormidium ambiguum IAM M-71]
MTDSSNFLYHRCRYRGNNSPKNLVFNANLQEFSQKVSYICGLETNGKLSPEVAYQQIHLLWKNLKQSKKQLEIGKIIEG